MSAFEDDLKEEIFQHSPSVREFLTALKLPPKLLDRGVRNAPPEAIEAICTALDLDQFAFAAGSIAHNDDPLWKIDNQYPNG